MELYKAGLLWAALVALFLAGGVLSLPLLSLFAGSVLAIFSLRYAVGEEDRALLGIWAVSVILVIFSVPCATFAAMLFLALTSFGGITR